MSAKATSESGSCSAKPFSFFLQFLSEDFSNDLIFMRRKKPLNERIAQLRAEQRQKAAVAWGHLDPKTMKRTAMMIAAFLLDERRENQLADWLLRAKMETAREIASGVAACSLRLGYAEVWDALAAVDAMDVEKATELFETKGMLIWEPPTELLL